MAHHTTPTLDRLAFRIAEFTALTGTSRMHLHRMQKRGHIKLIRIGSVPMVPRSEMVRLGLIDA
jgi:hypothetical protein